MQYSQLIPSLIQVMKILVIYHREGTIELNRVKTILTNFLQVTSPI